MKRVKLILLLAVCLVQQLAAQQDYIEVIKSAPPNANFYQVVDLVEQYFNQFRNKNAKGYKHWNRWKWYAERHLDPDGKVGQITRKNFEALEKINVDPYTPLISSENSRLNGDWYSIGPTGISGSENYLGRVNCVAFHPTNVNTIYAGTPAGGLWRSTSGGTVWTPLTDGLPSSAISGIAINPSSPNTMYILTGDGNGGNQWAYYVKENGCGVYKSTDGGLTWATTGLDWQQSQIRYGYKLLMHPVNHNVLIAATSNGIYRTFNGGASWTQTVVGEFQDIEFKPDDPSKMYATRFQNPTLYTSTDTGRTWITNAIPGGFCTRIEIAVTPANSDYAYLLMGPQGTGTYRGFYRYSWTGDNFALLHNAVNVFTGDISGADDGGFPWWCIGLWVSPSSTNNMLLGGVIGWRSTVGGTTWFADNETMHADNHGFYYNPLNGNIYATNDGGIFRSSNNGDTWTNITGNLVITQYYRLSCTDADANIVLGGAQDNGHHLRTTNTTSYNHVMGADGLDNGINYSNSDIMYGFAQYGWLAKSINGGSDFYGIKPDIATENEKWLTPFLIHTTTPSTIFYAANAGILRHTSDGEPTSGWTNIGGNGGGTFAMGTSNTNRMYSGNGILLQRTDNLSNAAPAWTIESGNPGWPPGLAGLQITGIDVNPDNSSDVWVSFSGYNSIVKVLHSTDAGETWVNETDNLPNVPVHVIKFQDTNGAPADAVYVGTDIGVFYRNNTIGEWIFFGNMLPRTIVTDMEINETAGVITVATYGRGFWRSTLYSNCITNLVISTDLTGYQYQQASNNIFMSSEIYGGFSTEAFLKAGNSIIFTPGMEVKQGNFMKAYIGPCSSDNPVARQVTDVQIKRMEISTEWESKLRVTDPFYVYNSADQRIAALIKIPANGKLEIYLRGDSTILPVLVQQIADAGVYELSFFLPEIGEKIFDLEILQSGQLVSRKKIILEK